VSAGSVLVDRPGGGVGVLTLNRPHVRNAIDSAMLAELRAALTEFDNDDEIRAIVLTGAGDRAFSAGADIHEGAAWSAAGGDPATEFWHEWSWYLATYRKPTIGALNGLVYGGAAQLAATLDLRVGCERTSFRFLYASVGRIVGTWVLPLVVGWAMAKDLLLTARVVGADEAYRIGLLNQLVPSEQILAAAVATGETIAKNHPTTAQGIKALLNENVGLTYEAMHRQERDARAGRFPSVPFDEAFKEFLVRRGPTSG
jgi:enoyl-CoA hydratase/carnithine racemase